MTTGEFFYSVNMISNILKTVIHDVLTEVRNCKLLNIQEEITGQRLNRSWQAGGSDRTRPGPDYRPRGGDPEYGGPTDNSGW